MTWRAPNRLRKVWPRQPDRINSFTHVVLAVVAGCIFMALLLAFIVLSITVIGSKPAKAYEIVTPPPCAALAAKFGATAPGTFTRDQAERALSQLNIRMILVPEARACRAAIIRELKK